MNDIRLPAMNRRRHAPPWEPMPCDAAGLVLVAVLLLACLVW